MEETKFFSNEIKYPQPTLKFWLSIHQIRSKDDLDEGNRKILEDYCSLVSQLERLNMDIELSFTLQDNSVCMILNRITNVSNELQKCVNLLTSRLFMKNEDSVNSKFLHFFSLNN